VGQSRKVRRVVFGHADSQRCAQYDDPRELLAAKAGRRLAAPMLNAP